MAHDDDHDPRSAPADTPAARPQLRPAMAPRTTTGAMRRPADEVMRRPGTDSFGSAPGPTGVPVRGDAAATRPAAPAPPRPPAPPPPRAPAATEPSSSSSQRASALDPFVAPPSPQRPAPTAGPLDPPLPPARPRPSPPAGPLDPPLPPARSTTRTTAGVLDPPVEPSSRRSVAPRAASGLAASSLDPALPPAGAPPAGVDRPMRAPAAARQTLMRTSVVAVVAVLALALVARVIGGDDDEARARLTPDEERAVAEAWRREGLTRMGGARSDDAALVVGQAVAGFGRMIGDRLGGRTLSAVVVDAPAIGDVFSLPDGSVVITTGLLVKLSSHAELAALVAHATAHVALGHTAATLAPVVPTLRAAAQSGTSSVVDGTLTPLLRETFAAEDEQAADAFAVQAMLSMGWDTTAYERALKVAATTSGAWATRHGIDDARLQRRGAVEPSGRSGDVDYRNGVLVPLGVVSAVSPPLPDTRPAANAAGDADEDEEEEDEEARRRRSKPTAP
jgi:hypothetical protein